MSPGLKSIRAYGVGVLYNRALPELLKSDLDIIDYLAIGSALQDLETGESLHVSTDDTHTPIEARALVAAEGRVGFTDDR